MQNIVVTVVWHVFSKYIWAGIMFSAVKHLTLVPDGISHLWNLYHVLVLFYIQSILTFLTFIAQTPLQLRSFVQHLTVTFRNEPPQIADTMSIYQLHRPLSLFLPLSHFCYSSLCSLSVRKTMTCHSSVFLLQHVTSKSNLW